jgi:hypothetical protein
VTGAADVRVSAAHDAILAAAGTGGGSPPSAVVTKGEAMIGKLIKAALIAAVLAAIVQSLPDIKRYLELRDM